MNRNQWVADYRYRRTCQRVWSAETAEQLAAARQYREDALTAREALLPTTPTIDHDGESYRPVYGLTMTADPATGDPQGWRVRLDPRDQCAAGSAPDSGDLGVRMTTSATVATVAQRRKGSPIVVSWESLPVVASPLFGVDPAAHDLAMATRAVRRRLPAAIDPATVEDAAMSAVVEVIRMRARYCLPMGDGPLLPMSDRPEYLNGRSVYGFAASRAVRGIGPSHGCQTRSRLPRSWQRETIGEASETATAYRYERLTEDGPVAVTDYREGSARYVGRSTPVAMGPAIGDPVSAAMASATGDLALVLRVARDRAGSDGSRGMATAVGRYVATGSTGADAGESAARGERYRRAGLKVIRSARAQWEDALAHAETIADAMPESVDALADL